METTAARAPDTYAVHESYADPGSPELASVGARLLAKMIDTWGVLIAAGLVAGIVSVVLPDTERFLVGILVLAWFIYYFLKDGFNDQSLGKRMLGIRVVHNDTGAPCTLVQSFFRNLATVLGIFDAIFALGSSKRRLGDLIAGTRVVKAR